MLFPYTTLNCGGRLVDLSTPQVMGILNVTPDSFYDGGLYQVPAAGLKRAEEMVAAGAGFIDIGGMSTRPGAPLLDPRQERARVLPVVAAVAKAFPEVVVSVDTVYAETAQAAAEVGAGLINDVSGGSIDPQLWPTVAALGLPYVLMHRRGVPATMQKLTQYSDLVGEVLDFFIASSAQLRSLGVNDIILDPGFGFAKGPAQGFELLRNLSVFKILDYPLLVGLSRKSMIYRTLQTEATQALNGTTALHWPALSNGAKILRVHDVEAAREVIVLWQHYQSSQE